MAIIVQDLMQTLEFSLSYTSICTNMPQSASLLLKRGGCEVMRRLCVKLRVSASVAAALMSSCTKSLGQNPKQPCRAEL